MSKRVQVSHREAALVEEGEPGRTPVATGGAPPAQPAASSVQTFVTTRDSRRESEGQSDKDDRVANEPAPMESEEESAREFDEDRARPAYSSITPLETVIGDDDRVQITDTRVFPWRAVCALRIRANDGSSWLGTGWFTAPRVLITAGHCVFMNKNGGWARTIEVIPGKDGDEAPFGSVVCTRFASVKGWQRDNQREYDYGAIFLPAGQALGARVGHFGFCAQDDGALAEAELNLSGYPGDKDRGATQWWHARTTKGVAERVIEYEIDTVGGQSGAPVWRISGGARLVVGVHTNGLASGNSATRIQANVFDNINAWIREEA